MNKQRNKFTGGLIKNATDGFNILVQPRDSVPSENIAQNAKENLGLLPKDCWITKSLINDEIAWVVSAGPSLERLLKNGYLRPEWFDNTKNKLFTIKHALPLLAKYGLRPHFCVVLDPREITGISTHGYLRQTLYSAAPKSTKFLVASMTHSSVTRWLTRNGYEIYGWHSAANGLTGTKEAPGPLSHVTNFVQGGTCSATRSISLAHYLGFRTVNLLAFDSNLRDKPKDFEAIEEIEGKKIRKFWPVTIGQGGKEFWTTGELIAQLQDLQMFLSDDIPDVKINILGADKGTSLIGALNESIINKTHLKHYSSQIGEWKNDN